MCSYWRSRLSDQAFCGMGRLLVMCATDARGARLSGAPPEGVDG